MLSTRNIEFTYNADNSFRFPDITCKKGEHWLIMGPSGCGKTTLLHLMAGLLRPAKGYVQIGDVNITAMAPSQVDRLRRSGCIAGKTSRKHSFHVDCGNTRQTAYICFSECYEIA